jgi:N-dimethylarginine dimethylaminohydrolase
MLTADPTAFLDRARQLAAAAPACARGVFLVAPEGMRLAEQSASDNAYMDLARRIDPERALAQHRGLHRALAAALPTVCFAGDPATPDAVFPNNVFATARAGGEDGRFLIGRMRHPVRQREAERADIHGFFEGLLGYRRIDLRLRPGLSELTGTLVIDRARGLGFAGLSPRCDRDGAAEMHDAFGLAATYLFALAAGEYHANVAMSVLAGRALVICPDAFADPADVALLEALYAPAVIRLDAAEQRAFAGNCIALDPQRVWMSETAADALAPATRAALQRAGFTLAAVPLDEIEKAGGSLRCCVGEIF